MAETLNALRKYELNSQIVKIVDLARGGAGVAKESTGRIIFVPHTAPGDEVRVKINEKESKKNYAQGELIEIISPSPIRITPKCPVFGRCGGCQWQHLPYELQWRTKKSGVLHALERVGGGVLPFNGKDFMAELPADIIWNYRNRIQLRGFQKELGFFAPGSHTVIPIQSCAIARNEINAELEGVRLEGSRLVRPFKVELEVLPASEGGKVRRSWNSGHAASGFRQVHDEQNDKLRNWISSQLRTELKLGSGVRTLYDLFGGFGNLSLDLAKDFDEIHCVDLSSPKNKPALVPVNYNFHRAAVVPWLLNIMQIKNELGAKSRAAIRAAIIDPPRIGLGEDFKPIADALEKLEIKVLVAVGCDPDAWARDVHRFLRRGWVFTSGAVVDLFPQTPHVESVAVLRKLK